VSSTHRRSGEIAEGDPRAYPEVVLAAMAGNSKDLLASSKAAIGAMQSFVAGISFMIAGTLMAILGADGLDMAGSMLSYGMGWMKGKAGL
jgi:hypothetical protein